MDVLSAGFWGGYFTVAAIMLLEIIFILRQGLYRIPLNAFISLSVATAFVVVFLGGVPMLRPGTLVMLQAHMGLLTATLLAYMLLELFGYLRYRKTIRQAIIALACAAVLAMWLMERAQVLWASALASGGLALFALGFCLRGLYHGERMTWAAAGAALFMLLTMMGLYGTALASGQVPWQVHAGTAMAATAYLVVVGAALWGRYTYLTEVRRILAHGPSYDPVTRLPSHTETSHLAEVAFFRHEGEHIQVGVLAMTIGNLYTLEKLHGRAAVNHAMFVCAGRLQRSALGHVTMGRLGDDGFLLLQGRLRDPGQMILMARTVLARLTKPVVLSTQRDQGMIEDGQTQWIADVGVGILAVADQQIAASSAVARARSMSRTALSYPSRVAWFDNDLGQIAELPADAH